MKTLKRINKTRIKLNGKSYKGYLVGDLPPTFAYITAEDINEFGEVENTPGIKPWFNHKGLTYIGQ